MTTSPTPLSTSPGEASGQREPLRLSLRTWARSHPVDGAWHPQSRDLAVEVADLVDHFPASTGRIQRLLFSRPDWDSLNGAASTRRIRAARGDVKVGSFPHDDTHLMILRLSPDHQLRILVVPSDTEPARAARILDRAGDDRDALSADELLSLD